MRRGKLSRALELRSRIALACANGDSNVTVAQTLGCLQATVGKWRSRLIDSRLDGLWDDPRPGRSRTVTVGQVEDVVVATLETTPTAASHWTKAKMARRTGLSKSTVGRIWTAFGLQLRRLPQAVHRPAVRGEGSRRRRALPRPPGVRGGAVLGREESGQGSGPISTRATRFRRILAKVDAQVPDHRSVQSDEADLCAWVANWNTDPQPFIWTKTADQIFESISRLVQRTPGEGH